MNIEIGKQYKHYKGGTYTVVAIGRLESDPKKLCVIYRSEYDSIDFPKGTVWIRPHDDFEGSVVINGVTKERFSEIHT